MPIEFSWDEANHIARDLKGNWIPSCTQILEAQGLSFDFRRYVKPDVLDRRSRIGTEVHSLTDTLDQDGEIPETWLTDDTRGYVESWSALVRMADIKIAECSVRMCESISGFPVTGEMDKFATIGRYPYILDLKTGKSPSDSWGAQLACYEMLRFRSPQIGRLGRAVALLNADGSPGKLIPYPDFSPVDRAHYGDTFLFALQNFYFRMRRGLISERDFIQIT